MDAAPGVFGAKLVGARMLPVRAAQTAAMLQYTMQGDHRVSVYVYDPQRVAAPSAHLRPRFLGNQPIYVTRISGYSIAAAERRGVGEHPHRGFETVTIVYSGEVEHRDSSGGGGIIGPPEVSITIGL